MNDEPVPLSQCKTMKLEDFHTMPVNRYLMEPKIDGWRLQVEADPQGVTCWTRTGKLATGKLPMVERDLHDLAKKIGAFRIDGEVVYLDHLGNPDFNWTSRCMGSGTDVCVDKQEAEEKFLSLVAFDILHKSGIDCRAFPMEERREQLEIILSTVSPWVPVIAVNIPSIDVHLTNIEKYGEGSVLKDITAPYAGKRHKSWLKWKKEETIDVRITGCTVGQGKYASLIGAVTFIAPDGTAGKCSGMDDDTRVYISDHRDTLIGRHMEIKHYGKLVDGYRHPQFMRFRPDKDAIVPGA